MQNLIMRVRRILRSCALLIGAAVLLAACSVLRVGYQNGEFIAYWWLNSYVDFDSDQTPWVKKEIADWFAWHRQTQLADYAKILESDRKRLQRELTQDEVAAEFDVLKQRLHAMTEHALPGLADLALSLRPQQITHIARKFEKNNDIFRDDYVEVDLEQKQFARYEKTMQQAEYWFGSFSREQQRQIRKLSDARPLNNELVMQDRVSRQQELLALLRKIQAEKPPRDAVIGMLRDYLNNALFERPNTSPELRAYLDASKQGSAFLAMRIVNLATPKQKEHAIKKAQQWQSDLQLLAGGRMAPHAVAESPSY